MDRYYSYQKYATPVASGKYYLVLFLLWPFLAFLTSLINYRQREAKAVVYIFLIYYGLTFFISSEIYVDAAGYAMYLRENAGRPFSDFLKIVGGIYSSDTSVDIIEPLISFVVSRFTKDYHILFGVFAAVFGYFYLKSINILYNQYKDNPGLNGLIHLAFFCLILPVTAINGFRMWTATWVFFYGAYYVILKRDKRFFAITLGAALVHWSFISANLVLLVYFFVGNKNKLYMPLAILSFIVPQFIAPLLESASLFMGGALQSRYEMYAATDYISGRQESYQQAAWFMRLGHVMVLYYLLLAIISIRYKLKLREREPGEQNLYSFLLLFLAFVNFGRPIPSFGIRFQLVFFLFATLYVFKYYVRFPTEKLNLITIMGIFPLAVFVSVVLRQGSDSINVWLLSPGFGVPFFAQGEALSNILF